VEIVTQILSKAQVEAELDALPAQLRRRGFDRVEAMFGIGVCDDQDVLWQWHAIDLSDLPAFIASSIEAAYFEPASSDLWIRTLDEAIEFRFCHESDVHLSASDAVAAEVECEWRQRGYTGYRKVDDEWQRFEGAGA
jgi:hypothetical protein